MSELPKHPVDIIGLGLSEGHMCRYVHDIVRKANVLVGGSRLLGRYMGHPADKITVASPLEPIFAAIAERQELGLHVVVLTSGDPLYYGLGRRLIAALGPERVRVHPNVTTLQGAAARLKTPWDDIHVASLHGRPDLSPMLAALSRHTRVAVYTDPERTPAVIGRTLMERGAGGVVRMTVCERLHEEGERIRELSPAQAAELEFDALNMVLLEKTAPPELPLRLGLPDDGLAHQGGCITKQPVRAAALAALALEPDFCVWDLGAGSGSVGVEACALLPRGQVAAVEKEPERCEFIRENARRTHAFQVAVHHTDSAGDLSALPGPDRVFVGGGLSASTAPLETACARLAPGGVVVVSAVLLKTVTTALNAFTTLGWETSVTQVAHCVSASLGSDCRLAAENPVFLIRGVKPE